MDSDSDAPLVQADSERRSECTSPRVDITTWRIRQTGCDRRCKHAASQSGIAVHRARVCVTQLVPRQHPVWCGVRDGTSARDSVPLVQANRFAPFQH